MKTNFNADCVQLICFFYSEFRKILVDGDARPSFKNEAEVGIIDNTQLTIDN